MKMKNLTLFTIIPVLLWVTSCGTESDRTAEEAKEIYNTEHAVARYVPVSEAYNEELFYALAAGDIQAYYDPEFNEPVSDDELEEFLTVNILLEIRPNQQDPYEKYDSIAAMEMEARFITTYSVVEALHYDESGDVIDSEEVGIAINHIPYSEEGEELSETPLGFLSFDDIRSFLGEEEFTAFKAEIIGDAEEASGEEADVQGEDGY